MERGIFTRIKMYVKIENKTQIRLNSSGGKMLQEHLKYLILLELLKIKNKGKESMKYIILYIIIQKIC